MGGLSVRVDLSAMRYSYVEPSRDPPPWARPASTTAPASSPVLQRAITVDAEHPVVPAVARRLVLAGKEARPGWVFRLTRSVTLNDKGNALVHHVFLRVYGEGGEPLGHCGWTAGHTTGARVWNLHPERRIPFAFVGLVEFSCWVENVPYEPPPDVERGRCPKCTIDGVRLKNDGMPYKHKDPIIGMECT
jgi:hypothetical protein